MSTDDQLVRSALIIVGLIVLLPVLLMGIMMPMMGMWGGGMWGGGHMWDGTGSTWMWLVMWVIVLVIIGGIGYLLYQLIRAPTDSKTDPAIEQLRNAYARGEITDEEFEQRRERLQREE